MNEITIINNRTDGFENLILYSTYCTAELSSIDDDMQKSYNVLMINDDLVKSDYRIFYFNRIKIINPKYERKGFAKHVMIKLCEFVDEKKYTIFCELNPYGGRDYGELMSFYEASGFIKGFSEEFMIRYPK